MAIWIIPNLFTSEKSFDKLLTICLCFFTFKVTIHFSCTQQDFFFLNLEILLEARCFLIGISVNLIGNINTHANHVQAAVPFKSWVSFHP